LSELSSDDRYRGDTAFDRGILRDTSTADADGTQQASDWVFELFGRGDVINIGDDGSGLRIT
jgi:hypothetical protein